jgi:hypothetical protein
MKLKKTDFVIRYLMKHGIKYTVAPNWILVSADIVAWVNLNVFDQILSWEYKPPNIVAPKVRQRPGPNPKPKLEVKKIDTPKVLPPLPVAEKWKKSHRCQSQQFREVMAGIDVEFISYEQMKRLINAQRKAENPPRPVGRPKNPNIVAVPRKKEPKQKKQGTFDPKKLIKFAQETEKKAPIQRPPAVYSNPNWSSIYQ